MENEICIDRTDEIAAKKAEWKAEKENRAQMNNGRGQNASSVFAVFADVCGAKGFRVEKPESDVRSEPCTDRHVCSLALHNSY
jgi:hypothetical protein